MNNGLEGITEESKKENYNSNKNKNNNEELLSFKQNIAIRYFRNVNSEVKCLMKTYSYYFEFNLYKLSFFHLRHISLVNGTMIFLYISVDFF